MTVNLIQTKNQPSNPKKPRTPPPSSSSPSLPFSLPPFHQWIPSSSPLPHPLLSSSLTIPSSLSPLLLLRESHPFPIRSLHPFPSTTMSCLLKRAGFLTSTMDWPLSLSPWLSISHLSQLLLLPLLPSLMSSMSGRLLIPISLMMPMS